jgi:hypothetical protein
MKNSKRRNPRRRKRQDTSIEAIPRLATRIDREAILCVVSGGSPSG